MNQHFSFFGRQNRDFNFNFLSIFFLLIFVDEFLELRKFSLYKKNAEEDVRSCRLLFKCSKSKETRKGPGFIPGP